MARFKYLESETNLNSAHLKQTGFRIIAYGSTTNNKPDNYAGVMASVTRRGELDFVVGQAAVSESGGIYLRTGKFRIADTPTFNAWDKIYG